MIPMSIGLVSVHGLPKLILLVLVCALMGDVIPFPFWRRQDQIAYELALLNDGDLEAFLIKDAENNTLTAPTRACALRCAYYLQIAHTRDSLIKIYYRPDEEMSYSVILEIDRSIEEGELEMEEHMEMVDDV